MVTDLTLEEFRHWNPQEAPVVFQAGAARIRAISRTYSDVPLGRPVAYFGSGGRLEVGLRGGNAAAVLHMGQDGTIVARIDR
jgi:S-adenosylmethionine hydrolase